MRAKLSVMVRRQRVKTSLTQQQLAKRMNSSQSRVAKIEAGTSDVSLDLMFSSLFALGGKVKLVYVPPKRKAKRNQR